MRVIQIVLFILLVVIAKSLILLWPLLPSSQAIAPFHFIFMGIVILLLSLKVGLLFVGSKQNNKLSLLRQVISYILIPLQLSFLALVFYIFHIVVFENLWINIFCGLIIGLIIFELCTPKRFQWIFDSYYKEFNNIVLVFLTLWGIIIMYSDWSLSQEIINQSITSLGE